MEIIKYGKAVFRTLSLSESLDVSRAAEALQMRRSETYASAPKALVMGELVVRTVCCDPPYHPPIVTIRAKGALGKRAFGPRRVHLDEQERNIHEFTRDIGFVRGGAEGPSPVDAAEVEPVLSGEGGEWTPA